MPLLMNFRADIHFFKVFPINFIKSVVQTTNKNKTIDEL